MIPAIKLQITEGLGEVRPRSVQELYSLLLVYPPRVIDLILRLLPCRPTVLRCQIFDAGFGVLGHRIEGKGVEEAGVRGSFGCRGRAVKASLLANTQAIFAATGPLRRQTATAIFVRIAVLSRPSAAVAWLSLPSPTSTPSARIRS
ncbi:hypothetical protein AB1N83_011006 [Pleurotus pulmonarius]